MAQVRAATPSIEEELSIGSSVQAQKPPVNGPAEAVSPDRSLVEQEASLQMTEPGSLPFRKEPSDMRLEAEIINSVPNEEEEAKEGPRIEIENLNKSEAETPKEESEPKIIFDMLNDDTFKNAAPQTAVNYFSAKPLELVD